MAEFAEREVHIRDYLKIIFKRQWTVLAFFVLTVTVTAVNVFKMEPVYQASARIQINRDNPNILSIKEVVEVDTSRDDYYQTQYTLLTSRSLALDVVKKLDLWKHPDFNGPIGSTGSLGGLRSWVSGLFSSPAPSEPAVKAPADVEGAATEEDSAATGMIDSFLSRVIVSPVRNTRLVDVSIRSHYPRLAASMANTLVKTYIANSQQEKLSTTREATDWLGKQLDEARVKVEDSENALQDYKERFGIMASEAKEDLVSQRLTEMGVALTQAKMDRIGKEIKYQQLQKLQSSKENLDMLPEVVDNVLVQQLKKELSDLQNDLSEQSKIYTPKHPKIIALRSKIESLEERTHLEVNKAAKGIRTEYEQAKVREDTLQTAMDQQKRAVQSRGQQSIKLSVLEREVENNRRIYSMLLSRAKETSLTEGLQKGNIRIIDRAEVPLGPIMPNRMRSMTMAVMIGLFGGVAVAFFLEYLDDTVKDPDDLAQHVKLPFLAPIPIIEAADAATKIELISNREPKSSYAETFRSARTNVLLTSPDRRPKTLLVTSPGPGEGKTTVTANLAATMAAAGSRVLLIDADLRKPRIHRIFDLVNDVGLSTLLTESNDVNAAIRKSSVDNLSVMTSGPVPPNPAELLGSNRMKKLLEALYAGYDTIIIDTAPLISVTDATLLATTVDGVIVVIRASRTSRQILLRGKKQLEDVHAHILGVILNGLNIKKSRYYYYPRYYYSYYGEGEGKEKRRRVGKVQWKRSSKSSTKPSSRASSSS